MPTSSNPEWYEIATGSTLMQGDVIRDCPIIRPTAPWPYPNPLEVAVEVEAEIFDLLIVSQSCDLENKKVDAVLAAEIVDYRALVEVEKKRGNEFIASKNFRKACIDGNIPGYALLHERDGAPEMEWSLVDFYSLHAIPRPFLERHAETLGGRLRLCSPYREHIAQSFAKFFMRVGLPLTAHGFTNYSPNAA